MSCKFTHLSPYIFATLHRTISHLPPPLNPLIIPDPVRYQSTTSSPISSRSHPLSYPPSPPRPPAFPSVSVSRLHHYPHCPHSQCDHFQQLNSSCACACLPLLKGDRSGCGHRTDYHLRRPGRGGDDDGDAGGFEGADAAAVAGRRGIADSHCLEVVAVVAVEVEEVVGMRGNPRTGVGDVEEVDGGAEQEERSRRFGRQAIQAVFGRCTGGRSDHDAGVVVGARSQGAIVVVGLA